MPEIHFGPTVMHPKEQHVLDGLRFLLRLRPQQRVDALRDLTCRKRPLRRRFLCFQQFDCARSNPLVSGWARIGEAARSLDGLTYLIRAA